MMMRLFRHLTALAMVSAMVVISCGGDESTDPVASDDPRIGIKILAGDCPDYIGADNIKEQLGSLAIQFYTEAGALVKVGGKNAVSLPAEQLSDEIIIKGIPNITNGRVVFLGLKGEEANEPSWSGEVRGVTFTKGKETALSVVLYPLSGPGCFPVPLIAPRFGHTVTELPDGRILIAGGFTSTNNAVWQATKSVELLDPESGTIDQLADMKQARAFHFATVLPDGRIIIAGGVEGLEFKPQPVTDYPDLPYTLSIPWSNMEVYTVNMPKVNPVTTANRIDASLSDFIDESLNWTDKLVPFQGYSYVVTDETTGSGILYAVGGVKAGAAIKGFVGIEITVTDSQSEPTVVLNEYYTDRDSFVAPLVAPTGVDNKILILGGHKSSDTKFAHLASKDAYDEWPGDAPNLFFGSIVSAPDLVIAASALELPKDAAAFTKNENAYRFKATDTSLLSGKLFWGTWFNDMVLNADDDYFTIIGGTDNIDLSASTVDASNFYEHVSVETMSWDTHGSFEYFNGGDDSNKPGRALHRVIQTANNKRLYIIGGFDDNMKGTTLVGTIRMMQMAKPWD